MTSNKKDPVLVVGEVGEPVDVLPHPLVGGVEEMRAVLVHLDPGLRVDLAVGVATEVVAPLEHEDLQSELVGAALRDGESEEAGAHDHEVGLLGGVSVRGWHGRSVYG